MSKGLSAYTTELNKLLKKSVENCIPLDGNCALYYSGGVDSSLISTYYDFKHKLTYNDESTAKEEFLQKLPEIMKVVGKPVKSFSLIGWWKLGEAAKALEVSTVISGEWADELFGGYIRYLPLALYEQAQKLYPSYKAMFPISKSWVEQATWERDNSLQELLEAEIKIAKHFGLEIKFPFGDPAIIEFSKQLPPQFKINNFETKIILNKLLRKRDKDYQPIEKQGLFCSVNRWLGVEDEGYRKETYLKLQEDLLKQNNVNSTVENIEIMPETNDRISQ